jgi:hypothetical protein
MGKKPSRIPYLRSGSRDKLFSFFGALRIIEIISSTLLSSAQIRKVVIAAHEKAAC